MAGVESAVPEESKGSADKGGEEVAALGSAIEKDPDDARAAFHLGNLLFTQGHAEEAITWWEKAARLDRSSPAAWRNLGIAYFNVLHDKLAAKGAYQRAFKNSLTWTQGGGVTTGEHASADPPTGEPLANCLVVTDSPRILCERDQLAKRVKEAPEARLAELERYPELVRQRDDLSVEYSALLNQFQRHDEALAILRERHFHPGEEIQGAVLGQWARTHLALGRKKLWLSPAAGGSPRAALAHFTAGLNPPANLGAAWPAQQNNSELHYWAGLATRACTTTNREMGVPEEHFEAAASGGDWQPMGAKSYSDATYWAGLAMRELGRHGAAVALFEALLEYAASLKKTPETAAGAGSSARARPLFEEDLPAMRRGEAALLEALARHGLNGDQGRDRKAARRLLNDVLADEPSHGLAADLMVALDWT